MKGARLAVALATAAVLAAARAGAAHAADADGVAKKAETCVACHGPEGNSRTADTPSLAGQPKQFITTQLVMFREGNRKNPVMSALTAGLTNADINELGSYFAARSLVPAAPAQSVGPATAGRQLTERLNCTQCHGAALKGQQHIPRLAGQQADYLRAQLRGFKAMTRFDMDGNMTSAVQGLAEADIDALADYLAGLQ